MDKDDLCIGCYRTSKEIRDWLLMEDDERLDVIEQLLINAHTTTGTPPGDQQSDQFGSCTFYKRISGCSLGVAWDVC